MQNLSRDGCLRFRLIKSSFIPNLGPVRQRLLRAPWGSQSWCVAYCSMNCALNILFPKMCWLRYPEFAWYVVLHVYYLCSHQKSVMSPKKLPPPLLASHVIFYAPCNERQKQALSKQRRRLRSLPPKLPSFGEKIHWQGLGSINTKRNQSAPPRVHELAYRKKEKSQER